LTFLAFRGCRLDGGRIESDPPARELQGRVDMLATAWAWEDGHCRMQREREYNSSCTKGTCACVCACVCVRVYLLWSQSCSVLGAVCCCSNIAGPRQYRESRKDRSIEGQASMPRCLKTTISTISSSPLPGYLPCPSTGCTMRCDPCGCDVQVGGLQSSCPHSSIGSASRAIAAMDRLTRLAGSYDDRRIARSSGWLAGCIGHCKVPDTSAR
jgi:hypothetical protein